MQQRFARNDSYNLGFKTYVQLYLKLKKAAAQGWPEEQLTDYVYDNCRLTYLSMDKYHYGPKCFLMLMDFILKSLKVPHSFGSTTSEIQEPIGQLLSYRDVTWYIYCPNSGRYYFPCDDRMEAAGDIPAEFQGQAAVSGTNEKRKKGTPYEYTTVPQSAAQDNVNATTMQVTVDGTTLTIDRTESRTGTLKAPVQHSFVPFSTWYHSLCTRLDVTEDLRKVLRQWWGDKCTDDDLKEFLNKERETEQQSYKDEVESYHGTAAKELLGHRLVSIGDRADSAAFVYNLRYTMDDLVKRAGNNLLLSVGQLLSGQVSTDDVGRQRTADIYMPAARTYELTATLLLPDGYRVSPESLAKLNTQVENACGLFAAQATVDDGGRLLLHITKRYDHRMEPIARWPELQQILDAASGYKALSLVLRRDEK